MISVMITGCSMHSYDLIRELRNNYENEEVRVVGINCSENALLRKGVDAGYIVPRIEDDKYWEEMIRISKEEKIDVIFPFITAELPLISRRKEWIENETGAKVSVSSLESLEAVGNKITLSQKYGSLMPRQAVATSVSDIDKFIDDIRYDDGNHDFCSKSM